MDNKTHRQLRIDQLKKILPRLFGELDEEMIDYIVAQGKWVHLKRSDPLFRQEDAGDSLYFLISGHLVVVDEGKGNQEKIINEVVRGESVGEMSLLTGEERSATVYATRTSELIEFSRSAFELIIEKYPQVLRAINRIVIDRLRRISVSPFSEQSVTNIAIIPAHSELSLIECPPYLCT